VTSVDHSTRSNWTSDTTDAAASGPEIIAVGAHYAPSLAAMTFPAYRHLLSLEKQYRHLDEADRRLVQPVALAAFYAGKPIALALLELPTEARFRPELLSLFVVPEARRRGVATWLLAACEQFLFRHGVREIMTVYTAGKPGAGKPSIHYFERALAKRAWSQPEQRMITVRFQVEELFKAAWIRKYRPRPHYRIAAWSEVTRSELDAARASDATQSWIAPDLAPWLHDAHGFEAKTSVAIYFHDALVGWLINHQLDAHTVRYTCSFIRPDLAQTGGILPAYVESFARLRDAGFTQGMFVTPMHHPAMVRFAERWFGPWASFVGQTRGSVKQLDASSVLAHPAETPR